MSSREVRRLGVRDWLIGLPQAVGYYLLLASGAPVLLMVVASAVGYASYGDRPGEGWYGLRLAMSTREVWFHVKWWAMMVPTASVVGAVLFVVRMVLGALGAPRWLIACVCGLPSLAVGMYLYLGFGWYIAIGAASVVAAGFTGFAYGAFLLPRLPIRLAGADGNTAANRVIGCGLLPGFAIVLAILAVAVPSPRAERAEAQIAIGCRLEDEQLSATKGGLTPDEVDELRRLGVAGCVGIVAIIIPWTDGRTTAYPRTVVVVPTFPRAPIDLDVAYTTSSLHVWNGNNGWVSVPKSTAPGRRVLILPDPDGSENCTLELEDAALANHYRYCDCR